MAGKNIILLSDGTGNSAAKFNRTNVWRVYEALDLSDSTKQIAYYHDGVGTSTFKPLALLGGGIGVGLSKNVRELYAYLCRNYEPGDRIYAFGFSRGAFTIRILTGFVAYTGILKRQAARGETDLWRKVTRLYSAYRAHQGKQAPAFSKIIRAIRSKFVSPTPRIRTESEFYPDVPIEFVGLWDTVEAYGMPIEEMRIGWDQWVWQLSTRNRDLSSKVKKAVHAICLDDERNTFHPLLWNENGNSGATPTQNPVRVPPTATHIMEEQLTQVWFAGMHSDVGGGYPDDAMSYVPLNWIIGQTGPHLIFQSQKLAEYAAAARLAGVMHDSRRGFSSYYRLLPRKIEKLTRPQAGWQTRRSKAPIQNMVEITRPKIHHSVFDRIMAGGWDYSPIVLPNTYAVVMPDGSILDLAKRPFEDVAMASNRSKAQERVWDLVWWRRVAYFTTLFLTACLALLPWMTVLTPLNKLWPLSRATDAEKCTESVLCFVAGIPKLLGGFLPSFAGIWVDAFSANPGIFALLALGIIALMFASTYLDHRIHDRMRNIWCRTGPVNTTYSRLYHVRESPTYQQVLLTLKRGVFPGVFGILFLAVILFGAVTALNRAAFSLADASGWFCTPSSTASPITANYSEKKTFDASDPCWGSGYAAGKGEVYRVVMDITGKTWADDGIDADLLGMHESLPPYLALPSWPNKRYLRENYMKPVARIRNTDNSRIAGQDEYVLDPIFASARVHPQCLVSDFTAASSGELFLFVNDAVFFVPDLTYPHNDGTADVYVKKIVAPGEEFTLPAGMDQNSPCKQFLMTRG
ncbi:DUF2235 domain-containing protein [soil metagenome]